jgi:hypothetical protein
MGKRAKQSDISEITDAELFIFRELPGELRYLLAVSAELPDVVAHAATGVRGVLSEISGDSPAAVLQRSAVQLRGHADQIQRAACDLLTLAGRLQGLAWASWISEREE